MICFRALTILYSTGKLNILVLTCAIISANIVSLATENVTATDSVTEQTTLQFINTTTRDSSSIAQTNNTSRVSTIKHYTTKTANVEERETTDVNSSPADPSWKTQTPSGGITSQLTTDESSTTSPNDILTSTTEQSSSVLSTGHLSGGSTQVTTEAYSQSTSIGNNDTTQGVTNYTTSSNIISNQNTTYQQTSNMTITSTISAPTSTPRTTERYKISHLSEEIHIVIQIVVPVGILVIIFLVIIGFIYATIKKEKEKSFDIPKRKEMTTKFSRDSYFRQSYIVNPSFAYDEPFDETGYNPNSLFSGNIELQRGDKIVQDISKKWTF